VTRDDIICMAREAQKSLVVPSRWCSAEHRRHQTERFYQTLAELNILRQMLKAVNEEREACAKVIDDLSLAHPGRADLTALQCAAAIRARGQE